MVRIRRADALRHAAQDRSASHGFRRAATRRFLRDLRMEMLMGHEDAKRPQRTDGVEDRPGLRKVAGRINDDQVAFHAVRWQSSGLDPFDRPAGREDRALDLGEEQKIWRMDENAMHQGYFGFRILMRASNTPFWNRTLCCSGLTRTGSMTRF